MIKVDLSGVQGYIDKQISELQKQQIMAFTIAGEEAVRQQTLSHKYLNQTGNLSSSVGYAVLLDGVVQKSGGFEIAAGGTEGVTQGKAYLSELIGENRRGLVLLVVAGMNYARYVENMGLDVLTSAELKAEQILPELLKELT